MSTILAALAALVELGEAELDTDTWQVLNGTRSNTTITKDRMLAVGDGDIVGTDPVPPDVVAEDYVIPLSVTVSLPGTDQALADAEAIAAYETIRDSVRGFAGGRLGLTAQGVMQAFPDGSFVLERQADDNGRHTRMRFGVRVIAHTT